MCVICLASERRNSRKRRMNDNRKARFLMFAQKMSLERDRKNYYSIKIRGHGIVSKRMKKATALIMLLAVILSALAGCDGEYQGIEPGTTGTPSSTNPSGSVGPTPPGSEEPFTVTIILDQKIFTETQGIEVQWADGLSVHRATFDENDHVAKITGLDGDYKVTLHGLPKGYTYDANIYSATNNKRNIQIEIFEHISTRGSGTSLYGSDVIKLTRLGAYTATIKKNNKGGSTTVYYEFSPSRAGTYIVDTIVDITANEINPSLDIYSGSSAYKIYSHTVDSGASEAEYTRNARYVIEVDAKNVGGEYTFGVTATHKDGVYPIPVTFVVRFAGDYENPDYKRDRTVIVPDQTALKNRGYIDDSYINGKLTYPEVRVTDKVYVFDGSMFALNPEDGFYHLVDENGEPNGPILFAKLRRRHRFFADYYGQEVAFDSYGTYGVICVEDPGNASLQALSNGKENYKLFVQGGDACGGVEGMEDYLAYKGYGDYVTNEEGVYPVTEELKEFLQKFSISQRYFNDGNGWAETTAEGELGYRIYSSEEDQWLFACCYFLP